MDWVMGDRLAGLCLLLPARVHQIGKGLHRTAAWGPIT